jgi:hypothetical protein
MVNTPLISAFGFSTVNTTYVDYHVADSEEEGEHQHDVGEGGEEVGRGVAQANEDHVLP